MDEPTTVVVTYPATPDERSAYAAALAGLAEVRHLADLAADDDAGRTALLGAAEALVAWSPGRELRPADRGALGRVGLIQLLSAGADGVDFDALPAGVPVAGNVGAYAEPMAEHALAMTLALAKDLSRNHGRLAAGAFEVAETRRLRGAVAGIVGFGGIGKACARLFRCLGMRVHAINTSGRADEDMEFVGTLGHLERVLRAADVALLSIPLTRTTRGLIGARELGWMKPDAILVNVARGAVVDETALHEHLLANPRFSAAIDTWWDEPRRGEPFAPRLPFLALPNVLGSPHNSGIVPGIMAEAAATAGRNVARFLRGEPVAGLQDPLDYRP